MYASVRKFKWLVSIIITLIVTALIVTTTLRSSANIARKITGIFIFSSLWLIVLVESCYRDERGKRKEYMHYIRRVIAAIFLAFGSTATFFAAMSIFHSSDPALQKVTAVFVLFTAWMFIIFAGIRVMQKRNK